MLSIPQTFMSLKASWKTKEPVGKSGIITIKIVFYHPQMGNLVQLKLSTTKNNQRKFEADMYQECEKRLPFIVHSVTGCCLRLKLYSVQLQLIYDIDFTAARYIER